MSDPVTVVIGATGYVGSHLVARLLAMGRPLRLLVRDPKFEPPPGVEVRYGDLIRADFMDGALDGAGVVYHCAAIVGSEPEPFREAYDRVNRKGTMYVARAAVEVGIGRLVYLSGLGTRPGKRGSYMRGRYLAEYAVRTSGVPYTILQPSVLFGDDAPFVRELASLIDRFPVFPAIRGGRLHFQPLWIEDLVSCLIAAGDSPTTVNRAIALGGADILSFPEVVHAIATVLGKERVVVPVPLLAARVQAWLFEKILPDLDIRPPLTRAAVELFAFDNTTRPDSVEAEFGFKPRGFIEHLRDHGLT